MSTLTLYVLLALPGLSSALTLLGIFAGVALFVASCIHYFTADNHGNPDRQSAEDAVLEKRGIHLFKWTVAAFVGATLIGGLVPDKEVFYALAAWEVGSSIDGIDQLPASFVEYFDTLLTNEIAELKGETGEVVEVIEKVTAD